MNVYWGRPLVLEAGGGRMSLKEAVDLASRAAPPDGWFVRASGRIEGVPNALLPSTDNAVTSANYRSAMRHGRGARRQGRRDAFHLESLRDPGSVRGTGGSRLYASVVESAVVTRQTWLMIQALPSAARERYERLEADSVVFHPAKLVAGDGVEFDELAEKYRHEGLPWDQTLDLDAMELVTRERIDAEYVSLRFPIGEHARRIGEFRRQAREAEGRGSGGELAWKVHANSMYGVLACAHLPTNDMVAGNVVTAWARAAAFALSQSLNAIQTVTDGCTFRLDQIPACTFEECVATMPEYPVRRAEDGDGIPFVDPAAIPADDENFTRWYGRYVRRFFGVSGPAWDELFDTHRLDFKKAGRDGPVAFDGLAADGSANYVKCLLGEDGTWRGVDFAARSFREASKAEVMPWLVEACSRDRLDGPAPLAEDKELLAFESARRKARAALASGLEEVVLPLGLEVGRTANYRCVKASAFTFETPEQRASVVKQVQRFEAATGCGLEVLALRRSYGGRRRGSLADMAGSLHRLVRSGGDNLVAALNMRKLPSGLAELARRRVAEIGRRREESGRRLLEQMDPGRLGPGGSATAFVLAQADACLVGGTAAGLAMAS